MRFLVFGLLFLSAVYFSESYSIAKRDASFYADPTKDDLVKRVDELKKLAADEIAKLKKEGKVMLATKLQDAEKLVADLEKRLEALNPTTELGKTLLATSEALLKKLETDVEAEIKKLSSGLVKRDAQADLLKTITDLLAKAHTAVATLEKEGKTALVAGLKKSVTFLMDVEKQLMTLKPTTELGKALLEGLEQLVKQGEAALEADLKKAEGGLVKRDAKDDLVKSVEGLKQTVADELAKLKAAGKTALAGQLQKLETLIVAAETTLKTLHPTTELGKKLLETTEVLVKKLEVDVEAEVKKLSGSFYADPTKDDLVKRVDELKKLAADEIAKLKKEGKVLLATKLQDAEKLVVDLENKLKALNPTTELGKTLLATSEALLKKLETDVEAEVKKLSGGLVKRDAQTDLLKTVADLLAKAHTAVVTLEKEGKPALVAGLKKSVTFLMDVEKQLMNLKPTTELGKALLEGLEQLVKQGEAALEADLKKAEGGF